MDHQVFLVRPVGLTSVRGGPARGVTRLVRIEENAITLTNLTPHPGQPLEYHFENLSNVCPSSEDNYEVSMDVIDSGLTLRFSCEARSALLTALLNRLDEVNGIGKYRVRICHFISVHGQWVNSVDFICVDRL